MAEVHHIHRRIRHTDWEAEVPEVRVVAACVHLAGEEDTVDIPVQREVEDNFAEDTEDVHNVVLPVEDVASKPEVDRQESAVHKSE